MKTKKIIVEVEELTPAEKQKYKTLKERLHAELEIISTAFMRAGKILKQIRDERLYRLEYNSFEEFCRGFFSRTRDYAYKLIAAYDLVQELIDSGVEGKYLPQSERLTRELSHYPKADRAQIAKRAHHIALSEGKEKPEVHHVRDAGAEISPKGKQRLIKALIEKLRSIKKALPSAISWEDLNQLQRLEIMTLLAGIEEHCQMLIVSAQMPPTVDVETEVKKPRSRSSIREVK
jgi:hypothetical protein